MAAPKNLVIAVPIAAVLVLALWPVRIGTAFGLPAHPLLLHVPVVFVPILGLATLVIAVRPQHTLPVAAFSILTLAATLLTVGAGEAFLETLPAEERRNPDLQNHEDAGETVRLCVALLTVTLAALLFTRAKALRAVAVLLALSAVFFVIRAGHLGSTVVWGDQSAESR